MAQLPPFESFAMQGRTYRYFTGEPVYPFGYGLSYTTFDYGPVAVAPVDGNAAKGIVVETYLTNTGARAGGEVAQLYLTFLDTPGVPRLALRGFQRVTLAPGEMRRLRFVLSPRDPSSVSPDGRVQIAAGRYRVAMAGGQPGAGQSAKAGSFRVSRAVPLPN